MTVQVTGVRDIPVADLTPLPGNPRRGDVTRIRESVARLGQYRTVVVRDTGSQLVILAGNHTARAIQAEGSETVRCEVITCTDDEARRIALADNRLSDLATDDPADLAVMLADLDGDFEATGWTEEDLANLIAGPDGPGDGDAPEDNVPEKYGVIIECDTEQQQARLLADLDGEGWRVRALMT